jgi:Txe/YoeB family toxin of Txe-Axe toxin-antitoxin module
VSEYGFEYNMYKCKEDKVKGEIDKIINNYTQYNYIGKGKAIPLQTLTGPKVSRRLRLPEF